MDASLVIIGTEITRGLVQDTHTKNLSFLLSGLGINVKSVFTVPDSHNVSKYIALAASDSDIIITTGGLGPTNDDMTRFELRDAIGVELLENKKAVSHIKKMTGSSEKSNSLQALIPNGFEVIDNKNGTALGFYGKKDNKFYMCLPGPPFELNAMLGSVKEIIGKHAGVSDCECYTYTLFATTEAHFNDLTNKALLELSYSEDDIIVGTCYKEFRVLVYLYTNDKNKAYNFINKIKLYLSKENDSLDFIFDGDVDLFDYFASLLIKRKMTVSLAESITGGLIAKKFTDIAGSSSWFASSIVSYSDYVKIKELCVPESIIKKHTAVSAQCALAMAEGAQKKFLSSISLSITGYAGPGGESVGKCFMGIKVEDEPCKVFEHDVIRNTRIGTRNACCVILVLHTIRLLEGK